MRLPEDVEQVLLNQGKVAAIKQLCESQGLSLKEAKERVESHPSQYRPPVNKPPVADGLPWGKLLVGLLIIVAVCAGYALATGML